MSLRYAYVRLSNLSTRPSRREADREVAVDLRSTTSRRGRRPDPPTRSTPGSLAGAPLARTSVAPFGTGPTTIVSSFSSTRVPR